MITKLKKLTVVYGHYGSGKTNLSLNLALDLAKQGRQVTLIDLDIVNPYFRSSDYRETLESLGIAVAAPNFAGTNLDLPSLPANIGTVLEDDSRYVVVDVGGDDAGAFALGRFASIISNRDDKEVLYVINKYRTQIAEPEAAAEILREIEKAARVPATAVVNNSHLQNLTEKSTILDSLSYAEEVSRILGLPLFATTVPKGLEKELAGENLNLYPVEILVKPPFY